MELTAPPTRCNTAVGSKPPDLKVPHWPALTFPLLDRCALKRLDWRRFRFGVLSKRHPFPSRRRGGNDRSIGISHHENSQTVQFIVPVPKGAYSSVVTA